MILKDTLFYNDEFKLQRGDIEIKNGVITKIADKIDGGGVDCSALTLMPGLVDIHIHGCAGADCSDMRQQSLERMSVYLACHGVTSFCPTTMTEPVERLKKIFSFINNNKALVGGAKIVGINMEGPYLSFAKKGSQDASHLKDPRFDEFEQLFNESGQLIKLVTVAPENKYAADFIKSASKLCTVSVGHTDSFYETAQKAFADGATHTTHLFNAMKGMSHRSPGTVGAVFDSKATAELICDGLHIHEAVLRTAFKMLGKNRSIIVSDAMSLAGQENQAQATLGGQTVYLKDGKACLEDGTLAASTTNLFDELKNVISYKVDKKQAIMSATINPARVIGLDKKIGSIAVGKTADIIGVDKNFDLKKVIINGKQI